MGLPASSGKTVLSPYIIDSLDDFNVVNVCVGLEHTAALTEEGQVLTWGLGSKYRLGHGTEESEEAPRVVEGLVGHHIDSVVCGELYSAALSSEGRVFTWGNDAGRLSSSTFVLGHGTAEPTAVPTEIEFFQSEGIRIVQIAGGKSHMLALDEHGGVWAWGKGDYGRLGNGDVASQAVPTPIEMFEEIPVKFIAAGEHHGSAIADDGEVWMWGRNHQGQLGMGGGLTMDMYAMEGYPCVLAANEEDHEVNDLDAEFVACGSSNAAMIADNGEVYAWGSSGWLSPHRMSLLSGIGAWKVSCGGSNFFALTRDGDLYSWSKSGIMGQSKSLGHGSSGFGSSLAQPTLVEALAPWKVLDVSAGKNHAVVVAEKRT